MGTVDWRAVVLDSRKGYGKRNVSAWSGKEVWSTCTNDWKKNDFVKFKNRSPTLESKSIQSFKEVEKRDNLFKIHIHLQQMWLVKVLARVQQTAQKKKNQSWEIFIKLHIILSFIAVFNIWVSYITLRGLYRYKAIYPKELSISATSLGIDAGFFTKYPILRKNLVLIPFHTYS